MLVTDAGPAQYPPRRPSAHLQPVQNSLLFNLYYDRNKVYQLTGVLKM